MGVENKISDRRPETLLIVFPIAAAGPSPLAATVFLLLVNGNALAVLANALETDDAAHLREQGIVRPAANVDARMDLRAALADEDIPGGDVLAVGALHAKALGFGITAVLGRADALLVGEKL